MCIAQSLVTQRRTLKLLEESILNSLHLGCCSKLFYRNYASERFTYLHKQGTSFNKHKSQIVNM